jgi:uncharacterized damage-inducible protein DinB
MKVNAADEPILNAWRINNRVSTFLVENIPSGLWQSSLPGQRRRTVRNIAAHLHNCRCLWLRSLAAGAGLNIPARVDVARANQRDVAAALSESGELVGLMLVAAIGNEGRFPGVSSEFVYGAMPRNALLFVGYALSHEAHHRGQILLIARILGQRLPKEVVNGLWQWSTRLKEANMKPRQADKRL